MARLPRLPDLLTTANLACGVGSILLASQGQLTWACWLVFAGAVFDVFDGLAARAMGQGGSEFGKQLDSLADMVTFGVAPGMLVWFSYGTYTPAEGGGMTYRDAIWYHGGGPDQWLVALVTLTIVLPSAWRLAKFNVDSRQISGFYGLPTPANALFWVSIILKTLAFSPTLYGFMGPGWETVKSGIYRLEFEFHYLLITAVVLGILMLSELPLPSLKFKHMKWRGNEVIYILSGIGLALMILYGVLAIPLILVLYLLSPLWGKLFPKENSTSSH